MENNFKEQVLTMLAKDGGTHTVGGKTFSVTVVENESQPTPDYSHLAGMWVKCVNTELEESFNVGKWYKCVGNPSNIKAFLNNNGLEDGFHWGETRVNNFDFFDLTNPLPYNPDTRIPLPEGVEFVEVAGVDYFRMNENQCLAYNGTYFVTTRIPRSENESYHLEPCTYGEVKEGDFFVFNKEVYLKASPHDIKPLVDGGIKTTTSTDDKLPVHRVVRADND